MAGVHLIIGAGLLLWYFWRKKNKKLNVLEKRIFLFAAIGNIAGLALTAAAYSNAGLGTEPAVERGGYGTSAREEQLEVSQENGENQKITVLVPARQYEEEETEEWLEHAEKVLDTVILGENTSLLHVDQDLNLVTQMPDSPVAVSWDTDEPLLVGYEGKLSDRIPQEGAQVRLKATLSIQEQTRECVRDVMVYPKQEAETLEQLIQEAAQAQNTDDSEAVYYLPQEIDGQKLTWRKVPDRTGNLIAVFGLLTAVLYGGVQQEKREESRRSREEELQRDYPEIVSALVLLLGAGLNMRKAVERLALDYQNRQRNGSGKPRAAYEELLYTWQEMESGVSELNAYEHLGARCQGTSYRALATLLTQNLKKGSKGLLELLEQESSEAFEERRRRARAEGEKAGTRLLLPMMMMLGIVFLLILIPAFMSFYA